MKVASLLFETAPYDPTVFGAISALLLVLIWIGIGAAAARLETPIFV